MPRPGPRPYECVRRAWHSDRHQPIRGSLIQEIFRIVNEVHCSATRKNREWQEKLPIVVLKAEEIMYSKANSEAEYSDLKTLWDRVSDAIDTIIRRDETSETGDFLQPCIEAALHLGCTPKRSSRSQRNDSPRYYLRPQCLDDSSVPPSNSHISSPLMLPYQQYSSLEAIKPLHSCSKAENRNVPIGNTNHFDEFLLLSKKFSPSDNHNASVRSFTLSDTCSVYPLCYDTQIRSADPKLCSLKPSPSNYNLMQSDKVGLQQNIASSKLLDSPNIFSPPSQGHSPSKEHGSECDLTLRLGSSSGSMC